MTPKRFVGLHNHTTFSPMDGLGYPDDHFKWCIENGLDGYAITEHGNMNSYAHAQLWIESWNKENKGKQFKYIPGVEAYFHPSLKQWEVDKLRAEEALVDKKAAAKLLKEQEKLQTKIIAVVDEADETEDIEMTNALTVENEDESKSTKHFNPVNRRHHLVVLPKNQQGLLSIFSACSKAYMQGFYRFPRIDLEMLKEAGKDRNIVVTSACIGGFPSWSVFQVLQGISFDNLNQTLLDDKALLDKCVDAVGNTYDMMVSAVGEGNYFLELQFNRLPAQNLVNRAIIEFANRNGLQKQLVVTGDAHYYNPDVWKERELYKKLGWMNYQTIDPNSLPKSRDELKCELYPKNAPQMWDEYLKSKVDTSFYDDQIICDAIERTHDIAHQVIGEVKPDRSQKFPTERLIPPGEKSFNHLVKLCKDGMVKRGLDGKDEYLDRLKEELGVIKQMKNADYFISYQKIIELARKVVLVGPGRGSGAGSLVAYVLYITDLDPIKWDLPFSRFLSVHRQGAPDIDSDVSDRDKVLDQLRNFFGYENVVPISNYNAFKVKSLLKDVSKFYGIPFDEVNAATRTVEDSVRRATMKEGDDKNLFVLTYDEGLKHDKAFSDFIVRHPEVGESMNVLFKQNRSLGRHSGGVLIADDLPNKMPLITSKGEPQSPWVEGVNFKHLEKIGNFIKYDILGLETLRLIERTIELILIKEGNAAPTFDDIKTWYENNMSPDVIDLDDQKAYETYCEGRWAGVFQCIDESSQIRLADGDLKAIKDVHVGEDVIAFDEKTQEFVSSKVLRVLDQGVKECIELSFDDGTTLTCTHDHLILTQRGWIKAIDLNEEDTVECFNALHYLLCMKKRRNCLDCSKLCTVSRCKRCAAKFRAAQLYPRNLINMSTLIIDKINFTAHDDKGVKLPVKMKFSYACDKCSKSYFASIEYERGKKHPWCCKSCSISLEWANDSYRTIHVQELKKSNGTSTARQRVSLQSKKNWQDKDVRQRMLNRDHALVSKKSRETLRKNLLSGKTKLRVTHGKRVFIDGIYVRSTYESRFIQLLNDKKISWVYEPKSFDVDDGKTYTPDFYIPSLDAYAEIKGWWRDDAKSKFDAFVRLNPGLKYLLIFKPDLESLETKEISLEACVKTSSG